MVRIPIFQQEFLPGDVCVRFLEGKEKNLQSFQTSWIFYLFGHFPFFPFFSVWDRFSAIRLHLWEGLLSAFHFLRRNVPFQRERMCACASKRQSVSECVCVCEIEKENGRERKNERERKRVVVKNLFLYPYHPSVCLSLSTPLFSSLDLILRSV